MLKIATNIVKLLASRPEEFKDRVAAIVDTRLDRLRTRCEYQHHEIDDVLAQISSHTHSPLNPLNEPALLKLELELQRKGRELESSAPYPPSGSGDRVLGRLCYFVCRTFRPNVVVETGVLYGNTTAYLLQALNENRSGVLHSIDLPPARDGSEDLVGCLVPNELRDRWRLHRGTSRRILPSLLPTLRSVDVFVHDSLHTYRNMRWEFQTVDPHLSAHAVVISDDVQKNRAFIDSFGGRFWTATLCEPGTETILGLAIRGLSGADGPAVSYSEQPLS